MRYAWPKLRKDVGAIDDTSLEIYRPKFEPEHKYYYGHQHFRAKHAQVVIDTHVIGLFNVPFWTSEQRPTLSFR